MHDRVQVGLGVIRRAPDGDEIEDRSARSLDDRDVDQDALSELAVAELGRIGREMRRLTADSAYIDGVLHRGAERAGAIAYPVLREAQAISGLLRP